MQIRDEQMKTFEEDARRRFEDEMVDHGKAFSPRLCEVLGDDHLRIAVRSAIAKAQQYGFTNRGPIRLVIELMFLCGSGFDSDPQYPAIGQALRESGDQADRAEKIYLESLAYLDQVFGPHSVNLHRALKELLNTVRTPPTLPPEFEQGMLREMSRIYPEKAAYIGQDCMEALIEAGVAESQQCGFPGVRHRAMMVSLMYSFGHHCTHDPLYPWIANTLNDEIVTDPADRADRLERKAVIWLDHVVKRNEAA